MSAAAFNAIAMLAGFLAIYWVAGRLLVDLLVPSAEPEERFPFAIGLGVAAVDTAAILVVGVLGLTGPWYLDRPTFLVWRDRW
ncbi:MAG: hypothetical protein FJ087_18650, partial [Deltaproteobacteria bacterium]|nr:hypothetical protein [Deltaproteobacteria bacterium]